jgi:hypothetical protein
MPKSKSASEGVYVNVKIHGVYDTVKKKVLRVSLDPTEIDMELMLIGENPNTKECVMEVTLLLDGVGVKC